MSASRRLFPLVALLWLRGSALRHDDKPAAYMAATELEKAAKRAKAASKGAKK